MHVASLELSKELFALTGWRGTEKRWYGNLQFPASCVAGLIDNFDGDGICPAYDLGFLLRELPEIRLETWHNGQVVISTIRATAYLANWSAKAR